MKRIVILFCLLLSFNFAYSQTEEIAEETAYYVEVLELKGDQLTEIVSIIDRKHTDLKRLEANRSGNDEEFRVKRRNIYKGTEKSIRMILDEIQLEKWSAYKKEQRKQNAELIKELRANGASIEDIKDAQYGIKN